jgi:hypothetical protein
MTMVDWHYVLPMAVATVVGGYGSGRGSKADRPCRRSPVRDCRRHGDVGNSIYSRFVKRTVCPAPQGCSPSGRQNPGNRNRRTFLRRRIRRHHGRCGLRSIPLDSHGMLQTVLDAAWQRSKYQKPDDLVFTNGNGGPVKRRNLLRRYLKPRIKKLGLSATVDSRSFRTMHSSHEQY